MPNRVIFLCVMGNKNMTQENNKAPPFLKSSQSFKGSERKVLNHLKYNL